MTNDYYYEDEDFYEGPTEEEVRETNLNEAAGILEEIVEEGFPIRKQVRYREILSTQSVNVYIPNAGDLVIGMLKENSLGWYVFNSPFYTPRLPHNYYEKRLDAAKELMKNVLEVL